MNCLCRISLNWPLNAQTKPTFGRQAFHQEIKHLAPRTVNDDIWTFNSQSSSQCMSKRFFPTPPALMCSVIVGDGLRHFAYQKEQMFYNGVTLDQIHSESTVNGIQGR